MPPGDQHRAIAIAHAGPAGAKHVAIGEMGVGVQADGRQFQLAVKGPAVERFDIDQFVLEAIAAGVELALGQGVEHEGVVGIGAMADADQQRVHGQGPSVRECVGGNSEGTVAPSELAQILHTLPGGRRVRSMFSDQANSANHANGPKNGPDPVQFSTHASREKLPAT